MRNARRGGNRTLTCAFVAAVAIALFGVAQSAQAYVYWTNPQANTLGRANLDGTDANAHFISGATLPRGVAVDGAHIYWVNANGTIGRSNLDGTGVNQAFVTAPVSGHGTTIAVGGGHIYWVSDFGAGPGTETGAIGRANIDGTGVDPNFITGISNPAGGIAADAAHVYWTNYEPNYPVLILYHGPLPTRIGSANADGSDVQEGFISPTLTNEFGVAADIQGIWWIGLSPKGHGRTPAEASEIVDGVYRTPPTGGSATNVVPPGTLTACGGLAVGATHVYWADSGSVGRARFDGTRATTRLVSTGSGCTGVAVDALGPPPSREFSIGKAKPADKHGMAELTVNVAGPGDLELAKSGRVKGATAVAAQGGDVALTVKTTGSAKAKLHDGDPVKLDLAVTYTPEDGKAATDSKKVTLKPHKG